VESPAATVALLASLLGSGRVAERLWVDLGQTLPPPPPKRRRKAAQRPSPSAPSAPSASQGAMT
jgi:hypothetical protein